jgi:hypothetical protein
LAAAARALLYIARRNVQLACQHTAVMTRRLLRVPVCTLTPIPDPLVTAPINAICGLLLCGTNARGPARGHGDAVINDTRFRRARRPGARDLRTGWACDGTSAGDYTRAFVPNYEE